LTNIRATRKTNAEVENFVVSKKSQKKATISSPKRERQKAYPPGIHQLNGRKEEN